MIKNRLLFKKLLMSIFIVCYSILIFGCTNIKQLYKIDNNWTIPPNKNLKVTITDGDTYIFYSGEYKIFTQKKLIKGLGTSNKSNSSIKKVSIPYEKIEKIETFNEDYKIWVTVAVIASVGGGVYYILD